MSHRNTMIGTCLAALIVSHGIGGVAWAQPSVQRVSGDLIVLASADSGGWANPDCTGRDVECDWATGWPSAQVAKIDPDYTVCCHPEKKSCCEMDEKSWACAESKLTFVNESATVKAFVWEPKLYGRCCGDLEVSETLAAAFNNLVLRIVDSANPDRRFRIEVQVELVEDESTVSVQQACSTVGSFMALGILASLGDDSATTSAPGCGITMTVSEFGEKTLYSRFGDQYCEDWADGPTAWSSLGTVCQGDDFRLGFMMFLEGQGFHQTAGDGSVCNLWECGNMLPIKVILRARGVVDGACP